MNNRGKALSHLELLKNRLIYLSTKLTDADNYDRGSLRSAINESWKTAYHYLGKGRSSFPDDFYLEIQALCYFSGKLPQAVVERKLINHRRYGEEGGDYLLEEVFTARRIQADSGDRLTSRDIKSYAMDMKKTIEVFYKVSHPGESSMSGEEKVWLERIRRLEFYDASALLVVAYKQRHSASSRIALLEQVEAMLFFRGIDPHFFAGKSIHPKRLAVELASKKKTISDIIDIIASACDDFRGSGELLSGLRQIGKVRNYYSWSSTRYFLFEYEQFLLSQTKSGRSKLDWDEFSLEDWDTDYVTLEHVYPQKASVPEWKEDFNVHSVGQRNSLKNSIGNLTPLSRRRNSALGNKSFRFKKGADGNKTGYAYGCYSEIEISQEERWTPLSILNRGLRLMDFMEVRWKLKLGSPTDKAKLLGIDFLLKVKM
ncbi:HNH endonuclease [Lysobacter enzymogenes]|uniref:HNH endonuclease n=2 Tax=Lysobacter enzymogenes TaxID=69 RepID=A0A3N2RGX2_LYSEN|nr:HNH endonuclease [Lysobacter enzymogenes]